MLIEGNVVLFAHDVSAEVGTYTADNDSFFVPVTDGTLNVRFVSGEGASVSRRSVRSVPPTGRIGNDSVS